MARFVRAYEAADLDALVGLLTDDAFMSMPPMPSNTWAATSWLTSARPPSSPRAARFDLRPTRANGQPAFGAYFRTTAGVRPGTGLIAITLAGDRVSALTRFEPSVLPRFGLPASLPG